MVSFESPSFFFLLALIPVGIFIRHFWNRRGGRVQYSIGIWKGDSISVPQRGVKFLLFISSALFWGGVVVLIIAMAGPARTEREKIYLTRGIDIMIVLDESPSMSAKDFMPVNRFESAKDVIQTFVRIRENDPIGLVSFSKEAAIRVPPTLDREWFLEQMEQLQIMSLGDGTAVGMGIAVAALHLEKSGAEAKIIVLLTDGENNAGEILPESAADLAALLGIRIYAIGIGTEGEVPIEYVDPNSGKLHKGVFESRFNEELLIEIAEVSGGRYFSVESPGALGSVFRTIDSVETTERRTKIRIKTIPRHRTVILIGLCLIFLDFFIRRLVLRESL